MEEPFKLEEIEDVRIIIKASGKNWALTPNKENAKKEDVDPKELRIAILGAILKLHDIVTPALEDIKSERASADSSNENSGLNIPPVSKSLPKWNTKMDNHPDNCQCKPCLLLKSIFGNVC